MSLTNGKVLWISFLRSCDSCWGFIWRAPEHLHNRLRPNPVSSLTFMLLCNANGVREGIRQRKKKVFPFQLVTTFHTQAWVKFSLSSPCYFPHEHSLPRPTFLSARPSSEHLPCARKKRRRWGVQIKHATLKKIFCDNVKLSLHLWRTISFPFRIKRRDGFSRIYTARFLLFHCYYYYTAIVFETWYRI